MTLTRVRAWWAGGHTELRQQRPGSAASLRGAPSAPSLPLPTYPPHYVHEGNLPPHLDPQAPRAHAQAAVAPPSGRPPFPATRPGNLNLPGAFDSPLVSHPRLLCGSPTSSQLGSYADAKLFVQRDMLYSGS